MVEHEKAPSASDAPRWRPTLSLLVLDGKRAELGELVPHPRRGIVDDIRDRDTFDCVVDGRVVGRIVRRGKWYGISDATGGKVAFIDSPLSPLFELAVRRSGARERELRFDESDTPLRAFALAALICGSPALGRQESGELETGGHSW